MNPFWARNPRRGRVPSDVKAVVLNVLRTLQEEKKSHRRAFRNSPQQRAARLVGISTREVQKIVPPTPKSKGTRTRFKNAREFIIDPIIMCAVRREVELVWASGKEITVDKLNEHLRENMPKEFKGTGTLYVSCTAVVSLHLCTARA